MKFVTTPTTHANKSMAQISPYINNLSMGELEELCDDPARNESGQEVQAVLTPHNSGFVLTARDGGLTYDVIDRHGRPMIFRSIEQALDVLSDVPHLLPEVAINIIRWRLKH